MLNQEAGVDECDAYGVQSDHDDGIVLEENI